MISNSDNNNNGNKNKNNIVNSNENNNDDNLGKPMEQVTPGPFELRIAAFKNCLKVPK